MVSANRNLDFHYRNDGFLTPEYWLSSTGQVAQTESEYSSVVDFVRFQGIKLYNYNQSFIKVELFSFIKYNSMEEPMRYNNFVGAKSMITFEDKTYTFEELEKKIENNTTDDQDKRFMIEALRAAFYVDNGITVSSDTLELLMINDTYASIVGVEGSKLIGQQTTRLVEQGIFEQSVAEMALKTKEQKTVVQNQSNGKTVLNTAKPIFNEDGKVHRVVSTIHDMPMLKDLYDDLLKQKQLIEGYKQTLSIQMKKNLGDIIAESDKMRDIVRFTRRIASNDSTVLILGESGVGKGVIADLIHTASHRHDNHKVSINCGAIPEQLLESELFGYRKGAFTGANREGKIGLLEAAEGGTVILDEIGELPLSLQPKLLTFLETGKISKVGSTEEKRVDSRIIAITNQDLQKMVSQGRFREDLYYRLNVIPIVIPPLRERREDIIPLILLFLNKYNRKNGCNKILTSELLEKMQNYDWPGNIRELRNTIERLAVLSLDNKISVSDLGNMDLMNRNLNISKETDWPVNLLEITQNIEESYIQKALKEGGSIREAAKLLGITPSMLYRKMSR